MDYTVHAERGLVASLDLSGLLRIVRAAGIPWSPDSEQRWVVIIDAVVDRYHHRDLRELLRRLRITCEPLVIQVDETTKTSATVEVLVEFFKAAKLRRRRDRVVVVGGGILCDLVGVAAAGFRRGVAYWRWPTSLIGMVDVGAGVKNAINVGKSKNLFGGYYPCELTLVDPELLATLPALEVTYGFAELIKVALGTNAAQHPEAIHAAFDHLEQHADMLRRTHFQGATPAERDVADAAIVHGLGGHLEALRPNLTEDELNRALDLGHILSGAIEMALMGEFAHGPAVALETALACAIAAGRVPPLMRPEDRDRVFGLLHRVGLPLWHEAWTIDLLASAYADAISHRDGLLRFPLPGPIGAVSFAELSLEELANGLDQQRTLAATYSPLEDR